MAKPIQVAVAADTRQMVTGIQRGVLEPLEAVSTALDDVSKDGSKAGESLADMGRDGERALEKLEDGLRDAQRQTELLEKDSKSMQDVIERGGKTSFKKFADNADNNMSKASASVGEFKDEAKSNISEVTSSFTGDLDSAVDGIQGTLGGLAASPVLGPYGLLAAAGGAAFGAMYAGINKMADAAEERIGDMYDDMVESGLDYVSQSFIVDEISKIFKEADGAKIALVELRKQSELLGIAESELAAAYAGDMEARKRVIDEVTAKEKALGDTRAGATSDELVAIGDTLQGYDDVLGALEGLTGEADQAAKKANDYRTAVSLLRNEYEKAADAQQDQYATARNAASAFNDELRKTPKTVKVIVEPDERAMFASIQSALNRRQFTVYADARTNASNRPGAPRK